MWHYRAFKVIDTYGDNKKTRVYWCVKEFYRFRDRKKNVNLWSSEPEAPVGDTKEELISALKMMLKDVQYYRPKTEDLRKKKRRTEK